MYITHLWSHMFLSIDHCLLPIILSQRIMKVIIVKLGISELVLLNRIRLPSRIFAL